MIAMPCILATYAQEAGMTVPEDPDQYEEQKDAYPHFFVFCALQLGVPMPSPTAGWENAKVIAAIPEAELKTMDQDAFIERGFAIGFAQP